MRMMVNWWQQEENPWDLKMTGDYHLSIDSDDYLPFETMAAGKKLD